MLRVVSEARKVRAAVVSDPRVLLWGLAARTLAELAREER
jgi:hypothetical protein